MRNLEMYFLFLNSSPHQFYLVDPNLNAHIGREKPLLENLCNTSSS